MPRRVIVRWLRRARAIDVHGIALFDLLAISALVLVAMVGTLGLLARATNVSAATGHKTHISGANDHDIRKTAVWRADAIPNTANSD